MSFPRKWETIHYCIFWIPAGVLSSWKLVRERQTREINLLHLIFFTKCFAEPILNFVPYTPETFQYIFFCSIRIGRVVKTHMTAFFSSREKRAGFLCVVTNSNYIIKLHIFKFINTFLSSPVNFY